MNFKTGRGTSRREQRFGSKKVRSRPCGNQITEYPSNHLKRSEHCSRKLHAKVCVLKESRLCLQRDKTRDQGEGEC